MIQGITLLFKKTPCFIAAGTMRYNIMYEEIEVYLHHWGLQYETIEDKNGNLHVGMYTVAICEDLNTGRIHTFMPNQLKLEGTTTYQ